MDTNLVHALLIKMRSVSMLELKNEFIFITGIIISIISAMMFIIHIFIYKIKSIKLNEKLDAEYGKKE